MTMPLRLSFILVLLTFLCSQISFSQRGIRPTRESGSGGLQKWALIIGINDYESGEINDLGYAVNDAEQLYQLLIDTEYGGFGKEYVKLITDLTPVKPTRNNILRALKNLETTADSRDTIFIYFSGHGIEEGGQSYFLPSDAEMAIVADTAISKDRFKRTMDQTSAKIQVMFFDACHSGTRKGKSSAGRMGLDFEEWMVEQTEGQVIFASCGLSESSYEYPAGKHGAFTYFLLEGLRGSADENMDGVVSVTESANYTTRQVKIWAYQADMKQNPWMSANITGEILLTVNRKDLTPPEPPVKPTPVPELDLPDVLGVPELQQLDPGKAGILWRSIVFPGWGQLHAKNNAVGGILAVASVILSGSLIYKQADLLLVNEEYGTASTDYRKQVFKTPFSQDATQQAETQLNSTYRQLKDTERWRNNLLTALGTVWAGNLLHAALTKSHSMLGSNQQVALPYLTVDLGQRGLQLGLKTSF